MSNGSVDFKKEGIQSVRTRSLYTAHTFTPSVDEPAYQFPDSPCSTGEPWLHTPNSYSSPSNGSWRYRAEKPYSNAPPHHQDDHPFYYSAEQEHKETPVAAEATPYGTICIRLAHRIRVDMTIDRAIRVINLKNSIVMTMNATGSASALFHPNGRVHQYGSRVEIMANDTRGNHKYAKMWYKGVSFTAENCALVYLVDSAGTRTTTDNFSDLTQDFSMPIFYNDSRHGPHFTIDAMSHLQASQYWVTEEGLENWIINGVRVSQAPDGLVRIAKNGNKYHMRTSPTNGTASIITPYLHCTASMGNSPHLFVRRGERRMHYDGSSFVVRNAGHSAGFDERTKLKVF